MIGETTGPRLSDWNELAQRRGPNLGLWLLASAIGAGVMLFISPLVTSWPVLASSGVLFPAPLVFRIGWVGGVTKFADFCESFRSRFCTVPLVFQLPVLLTAVAGIAPLG